jgi:hypothetical protein
LFTKAGGGGTTPAPATSTPGNHQITTAYSVLEFSVMGEFYLKQMLSRLNCTAGCLLKSQSRNKSFSFELTFTETQKCIYSTGSLSQRMKLLMVAFVQYRANILMINLIFRCHIQF